MLVPLPEISVPGCASSLWQARPQVICRPRRLFIDRNRASDFVLEDIKVGTLSATACYGQIPCDIFAADLDRIEKKDMYEGLIDFHSIDLDMPVVQPGYVITLNIRNIGPSQRPIRGAFDAVKIDEDRNEIREFNHRHVVSISTSNSDLFALCKDGTLWKKSISNDNDWHLVKPIPNKPISEYL